MKMMENYEYFVDFICDTHIFSYVHSKDVFQFQLTDKNPQFKKKKYFIHHSNNFKFKARTKRTSVVKVIKKDVV